MPDERKKVERDLSEEPLRKGEEMDVELLNGYARMTVGLGRSNRTGRTLPLELEAYQDGGSGSPLVRIYCPNANWNRPGDQYRQELLVSRTMDVTPSVMGIPSVTEVKVGRLLPDKANFSSLGVPVGADTHAGVSREHCMLKFLFDATGKLSAIGVRDLGSQNGTYIGQVLGGIVTMTLNEQDEQIQNQAVQTIQG